MDRFYSIHYYMNILISSIADIFTFDASSLHRNQSWHFKNLYFLDIFLKKEDFVHFKLQFVQYEQNSFKLFEQTDTWADKFAEKIFCTLKHFT